jgi:eukaryotic-like serine/threonine-protein kinase
VSAALQDRNLLFGIVALQLDFVTRDQLVAAMQAWVLDKKKSLAQLLVERDALTPARRIMLEPLVEEHVRQHQGDPQRSLAALSSADDARQALQAIDDPDLQDTLRTLSIPAAPAAPRDGATIEPAAATGVRFRILRQHAKGGLGVVFLAHDQEVNRQVALKEIQSRFARDPDARQRFELEAEITGGLEHPGIVPVYGLGRYDDGRPYYAMRFIKGDSLKEAVDAFHAADKQDRDATERDLSLRQLLRRFIDVCNAVDYAHSKGVLHRDLKPGNIMLGKFGETLVVDWGLAKATGKNDPTKNDPTIATDPKEAPEAPLTPSSGSGAPTQMGSAIGTPAFMPPEQAAGRLDLLGPASDVYSLGATLYYLLTGKPPFERSNILATLDSVREGRFPPPRVANPAVEAPLNAICLKAMAREVGHRYESAAALRKDIENWIADAPVSAWREPFAVKARRWLVRHRVLATTSLVALLLGAGFLGVLAVVTSAANEKLAGANEDLALLAEKERTARKKAESEREAADIARHEASTQRYHRLVNGVAKRLESPTAGWTWESLADLRAAGELDTPSRSSEELRSAAAKCLAGTDLRAIGTLGEGTSPSWLAFSPDGKLLAVAASRAKAFLFCTVSVYEVATRKLSRQLSFSPSLALTDPNTRLSVPDGVRQLAFSADGKRVMVGTRSGWIHLWDLNGDAKPISWQAHPKEFRELLVDKNNDALITSSAEGVTRWALSPPGKKLASFPCPAGGVIDSIALDPGNESLLTACGGTPRQGVFLDPKTLTPLAGRTSIAWNFGDFVSFFPSGKTFAMRESDRILMGGIEPDDKLRPFTDQGEEHLHVGHLGCLRIHPDGNVLASTGNSDVDRSFKLWEAASGTLLLAQGIGGSQSEVQFRFSPDGRTAAVTADDRVILHEFRTSTFARFGPIQASPVLGATFGDQGRSVAMVTQTAGPAKGQVTRNERPSPGWKSVASIEWPLAQGLAFMPAGPGYAVRENPTRVLVSPRGEAGDRQPWPVKNAEILKFSRDGDSLWAVLEASEVVRWDTKSGKPRSRWSNLGTSFLTGRSALHSLAVAKRWAVAGGRDGAVRVFRTDDGQLHKQWASGSPAGIEAIAIDDDERLIATGNQNGEVRILSLPDGRPIVSLPTSARCINALSFGKGLDSQTLAVASKDGRLHLWKVEKELFTPILTYRTAKEPLQVEFSSDGKEMMYLARGECAVRIWAMDALRRELRDMNLDW